jgi:hypothetical protein
MVALWGRGGFRIGSSDREVDHGEEIESEEEIWEEKEGRGGRQKEENTEDSGEEKDRKKGREEVRQESGGQKGGGQEGGGEESGEQAQEGCVRSEAGACSGT